MIARSSRGQVPGQADEDRFRLLRDEARGAPHPLVVDREHAIGVVHGLDGYEPWQMIFRRGRAASFTGAVFPDTMSAF